MRFFSTYDRYAKFSLRIGLFKQVSPLEKTCCGIVQELGGHKVDTRFAECGKPAARHPGLGSGTRVDVFCVAPGDWEVLWQRTPREANAGLI